MQYLPENSYLLKENGFEAYRIGEEIHFLNRKTYMLDSWYLWTGLLAFCLFAFLLICTLILNGQKLPALNESPAFYVIGIIFAINFSISFATRIVSKKRSKTPSDQVNNSLVADLQTGYLMQRFGPVLAKLQEVTVIRGLERITTRPIWWQYTLFLDLHWPGGKFRIYHGNNVDHLNELRHNIMELGIGQKRQGE